MKKNKLYTKHIFVCVNQRDASTSKSCGKIGIPLRMNLKNEIIKKELNDKIRINKSGCLGQCSQGPCAVIYPEGDWKFNMQLEDAEIILEQLTSD